MPYAENTSVSVARSKDEIETTLRKYGASSIATMSSERQAIVAFEMSNRRVMFELALPAPQRTRMRYGKEVAADPQWVAEQHESACRSAWRALMLAIKAKLVSIESGVEQFDEAFLAHIMVPGKNKSQRFGPLARKALDTSYNTGTLPPLLGD